jgi:hypothetical protein
LNRYFERGYFRIRIPEQGGCRPPTNRPSIAPETPEQNKLKPDYGDEPALNPLNIFAERSLHTAEVAGYIGAIMSYWACAQLEANRERLAVHCLGLAGYPVYLPCVAAVMKSSTNFAPVRLSDAS